MNLLSALLAILILNVTPPTGPQHSIQPMPPTGLTSTRDLATCLAHAPGLARLVCAPALASNELVLVWDWKGPAFSGCPAPIDGFRVYRVDRGQHALIDSVTTVDCDPVTKTYIVGTVGVVPHPGFGACYDVVAVSGSRESDPSNTYCLPVKIPPLVTPH
jgi:hypothetical protein